MIYIHKGLNVPKIEIIDLILIAFHPQVLHAFDKNLSWNKLNVASALMSKTLQQQVKH